MKASCFPCKSRFVSGSAALLALVLVSSLHAQTTSVTTDPVGFVTLTVKGAPTAGDSALSFIGLSMTQPVDFQGVVATPVSPATIPANTVPASNSAWTDNLYNAPVGDTINAADKAYFVEITTGANAGRMSDIVGTVASSQSLQTADNLALTGGESFKIRRHWTLNRIFGPNANTNNQVTIGGGIATEADEVLVYDTTKQTYLTYYYQTTGLGGIGWRSTADDNVAVDNQPIPISRGMIIRRKHLNDVSVTLSGAVKLGPSKIKVENGLNFSANVYPSGNLTLQNSGLYDATDTSHAHSFKGGVATDADQLLIYNNTANKYFAYYYQTTGLGGSGWRSFDDDTSPADTTPIPSGQSVILRRVASGTPFFWTVPQPF